MPYLPWPTRWPTYTPAGKHANWLENYADSLDLKHWTNANVASCLQDASRHEWTAQVEREGEGSRTIRTKHVVMATGLAGAPKMPTVEGMETFKGRSGMRRTIIRRRGTKGRRCSSSGRALPLWTSRSTLVSAWLFVRLALSNGKADSSYSTTRNRCDFVAEVADVCDEPDQWDRKGPWQPAG